jgi:hypothetical protein
MVVEVRVELSPRQLHQTQYQELQHFMAVQVVLAGVPTLIVHLLVPYTD